jgi:short-subunit dehydrogenase
MKKTKKDLAILITGASTGIGRACARFLAGKGHRIYGTTRNKILVEEGLGIEGVTMLYLDVTEGNSVKECVAAVIRDSGGIDVLINNAGMGMAGSIEDTEYDEFVKQFDTNVFGAIRVINEVLPNMRKSGKGVIINIGSVAGFISIPYQAAYSAGKAAITSFTFSLRNEIRQFGLDACVVHPGDLKTDFTFNRKKTRKSNKGSVYIDKMERSIEVMARDEQNGGDPVIIAKAICRILNRKHPPIVVTVGLKYKVISFLFRIVPARLRESIIASIYS